MTTSTLPRGSTQVRAPASVGTPIRVGKTRKFRKMILPRKVIKAGGRTIDLSQYFNDLVHAERTGAFDSIPLQVAPDHTKDPRATEGTISNLVHLPDGPDGDGLYGDLEFADEDGVKLIRKNPKVGVSPSIVENLVRHEDGQDHRWRAAIQHVLLTTDPHVRRMGGYHPIELAHNPEGMVVIDLSGTTYEEIQEEPMTAPTTTPTEGAANPPAEGETPPASGDTVTLEVTPEQRDALLQLLEDQRIAAEVAAEGPPAGDDGAAPPAGVSLSRQDGEGGDTLELMRTEIETEREARLELQRELSAARAAEEIGAIERTGLAPAIVNAARPLLEQERGSGLIQLSRGGTIDPTQVVRDVLHQVIELSRRGEAVIDFDVEAGMHVGGEAEQAARQEKLKAWAESFGD